VPHKKNSNASNSTAAKVIQRVLPSLFQLWMALVLVLFLWIRILGSRTAQGLPLFH
jgi:hypothetical protein